MNRIEERNEKQSFKKWLDLLQQESWQLELLISGFAIFGLTRSYNPLMTELFKAVQFNEEVYAQILSFLVNGMSVLIIMLVFHVLVRGLWIGTLGLRYVSKDIEYEELGYSEKFTTFLKKKVGSFDRYIERLENISSTLFPLAFLMIFFLLSFFLSVYLVRLLVFFLEALSIPKNVLKPLSVVLLIGYFLILLTVFIDFITMGGLKKNKTIAKIYFPIYRFASIITLSFLYRPLLYNFLDSKRIRWVAAYILPVYVILSVVVGAYGKTKSNYLYDNQESSIVFSSKLNYDNLMEKDKDFANFASIPSKVIEDSYTSLYIPFTDVKEDIVFHQDSTLIPAKDKRGYNYNRAVSRVNNNRFTTNPNQEHIEKQEKYLRAVSDIYDIFIDTIPFDEEFILTTKRERVGFETYIDLQGFSRGKHYIRIVGLRKEKKEFVEDTLITIPFWYYPDAE